MYPTFKQYLTEESIPEEYDLHGKVMFAREDYKIPSSNAYPELFGPGEDMVETTHGHRTDLYTRQEWHDLITGVYGEKGIVDVDRFDDPHHAYLIIPKDTGITWEHNDEAFDNQEYERLSSSIPKTEIQMNGTRVYDGEIPNPVSVDDTQNPITSNFLENFHFKDALKYFYNEPMKAKQHNIRKGFE